MGDWDWGSSDMGSGSSGGFSADDYYWTGGKFQDWSGKSAGKFDDNSSGYSGGSYGYGCGRRADDEIKKEIALGMPHEPSIGMPIFMTKIKMAFAIMRWLCVLLFLALCMAGYLNGNDESAVWIVVIPFACGIALNIRLLTQSERWYPVLRAVTRSAVRRFYRRVQIFVCAFYLCQLVLSLLPLFVYVYVKFSADQVQHAYGEWYILPFVHRDPSQDLSILFVICLCLYFGYMALWGYLLFSGMKVGQPQKYIDKRYVYLKNKAGELDKHVQELIHRKNEAVEQIQQKQSEISKLQADIKRLDEQLSKLT